MIRTIISKANQIPFSVRAFLIKALIVFIIWNTFYHFILSPSNIPDKWLTKYVSIYSYDILTELFPSIHFDINNINDEKMVILKNNQFFFSVNHHCNGLELYALYIGFILCLPTYFSRRLFFILVGTSFLFFLNVVRITALGWVRIEHSHWLSFSHKFLFKGIMYAIIFLLWHNYAKKAKLQD